MTIYSYNFISVLTQEPNTKPSNIPSTVAHSTGKSHCPKNPSAVIQLTQGLHYDEIATSHKSRTILILTIESVQLILIGNLLHGNLMRIHQQTNFNMCERG